MTEHSVVSAEQWLVKRKELLKKEKEFTKLRDELTRQRQELPWQRVEKQYQFKTNSGDESLADLFGDCSQLLVYHFMFAPQWTEGCKACSLIADHYDPLIVHLQHRDVNLVTVSRTNIETIDEYKKRMGWNFKWVSSLGSDFNRDYHVTFTTEERESGSACYNYQENAKFPVNEAPGISSFIKDEAGNVYHTYSSYGRGLENLMGIYGFLDIVAKGRDESELPYPMFWVRHRDKYEDRTFVDPYVDKM